MKLDPEFVLVLWLALGYLLVSGSLYAQQGIQNEVVTAYAANGHNINVDAGYYSQCLYYVGFALCALLTAPLVTWFGPKAVLLVASALVLLYMGSFLYLNQYLLYVVSLAAGAAVAIMRSSRGHFVVCISQQHNLTRNTSVFWFTYFMWQPLSAGFLYAVLYDETNMSDARIRLIYGLLAVATLLGLLCFWLLLPTVTAKHRTRALANCNAHAGSQSKLNRFARYAYFENVKMLRLAGSRAGLYLLPVFLNVGAQVVLDSSVYPTALGFTTCLDLDGPTLIALHNLCMGVGAIAASPLACWWSRRAGRAPVYVLQMALELVTLLLIAINLPEDAPLQHTDARGLITPNRVLALVCSGLMGVYGSLGANANSALIAALYPGDEAAQAYSWAACTQTAFSVLVTLYASRLLLSWQLLIAALLAVVAAAFSIVLEWTAQANPKGLHFD